MTADEKTGIGRPLDGNWTDTVCECGHAHPIATQDGFVTVFRRCRALGCDCRQWRAPTPPDAVSSLASRIVADPSVPRDEVYFADEHGKLLGKIVGISWPPDAGGTPRKGSSPMTDEQMAPHVKHFGEFYGITRSQLPDAGGTAMTELDMLRALAKMATPGPWRTITNRPFGPWVNRDCEPLAADSQPVLVRNWKEACSNAAYIAACSPERILALLDEVTRLRTEATRPMEEEDTHVESNVARLDALGLTGDFLGERVREAWVRWAERQPSPKPHWLVPWSELGEADRDADREIGRAIALWTLLYSSVSPVRAPSTRPTGEEDGDPESLAGLLNQYREHCRVDGGNSEPFNGAGWEARRSADVVRGEIDRHVAALRARLDRAEGIEAAAIRWVCNKCGSAGSAASSDEASRDHAMRSPKCDYYPGIIPPGATIARLEAENRELWEIIRQKERDAYAASNSLNVAELDARCCDLAIENIRLRAALSTPTPPTTEPTA